MSDTLELLTRAAQASASTVNAEARTVQVVFATEAPVQRRDYDGPYNEILEISKSAILSGRLETGMSVLDSHRSGSMANRLGSVVPGSLRIEQNKAVVTIKLSRKPDSDAILQDVLDGHILPISVGYRIEKSDRTEATGNEIATVRATLWEPLEISIVSVPADASAHSRQKEPTMPEEQKTETNRAAMRVADRRTFINSAPCLAMVPDAEEREELVQATRGMNQDQVRAAVFDAVATRQEAAPTFPVVETGQGQTSFTARSEALYSRITGQRPEGFARDFMDSSLVEHARGLLEERGVRTNGLSRDEVFARSFHTTSDFPLLLQSTSNRILHDAFVLAQSPVRTMLTRSTTMNDFRAKQGLRVSDMGLLTKVNEAGEITSTTRAEIGAESYKLDTFARMFSLTRQALINDDLSGLSDFTATAGRMAAETENELVFSLLASNPTMGEDGVVMFHADHGNLAGTGTGLDVGSLTGVRKAMRSQKTIKNGKEHQAFISVTPKYLVVGPELETAAEMVLTSLNATTTADVNPFAGTLTLLVEPRITDASWYVFAEPSRLPVLEAASLSSAQGPQMATQEGFDVMGVKFRVSLDFGCGAVDFRGAYRNPGV